MATARQPGRCNNFASSGGMNKAPAACQAGGESLLAAAREKPHCLCRAFVGLSPCVTIGVVLALIRSACPPQCSGHSETWESSGNERERSSENILHIDITDWTNSTLAYLLRPEPLTRAAAHSTGCPAQHPRISATAASTSAEATSPRSSTPSQSPCGLPTASLSPCRPAFGWPRLLPTRRRPSSTSPRTPLIIRGTASS